MATFKITVKAEKVSGGNFPSFEVKMQGMSVGKMMALRRALETQSKTGCVVTNDVYCGVRNAMDTNHDYLMAKDA